MDPSDGGIAACRTQPSLALARGEAEAETQATSARLARARGPARAGGEAEAETQATSARLARARGPARAGGEAEAEAPQVSRARSTVRVLTRDEYASMRYALPANASVCDRLLCQPRELAAFVGRLNAAFGWRYVAFVAAVYGLNQGVGESFASFAAQYLLTDAPPNGFGLTPERYSAVDGFANIPWQMKAMYGMASDLMPIAGYRRSPYIMMAAVAGTLAFSVLAFSSSALAAQTVAILLLLANFSMASPDVMIDASIAERTGAQPHFGPDLQALAWGSLSVGSLVASVVQGYELSALGSRSLFAISIVTAAVLLPPALWGWLAETRIPAERVCCGSTTRTLARSALVDPVKGPILVLALALCALSFGIGGVSVGAGSASVVWAACSVVCALTVVCIYALERRVSLVLAKASIYVFLIGAMQPSSSVLFYWYKQTESSCSAAGEAGWRTASVPRDAAASSVSDALFGDMHNTYPRPCFSPEFVGWMGVVGYVSFAAGTYFYHRYFTAWTYRRIWQMTQVAFVLLNLLDFVWVSRLNLKVGIPDTAFVMGEEVLSPVFARLAAMPMFILVSRLCPPGIEATLFALTMGLSNFGAKMGSYLGIGLLDALGGVAPPVFRNLRLLVFIRSLTRAIPLLLIPFLVPTGSPSDLETPASDARSDEKPENVGSDKARAQSNISATDSASSGETLTTARSSSKLSV